MLPDTTLLLAHRPHTGSGTGQGSRPLEPVACWVTIHGMAKAVLGVRAVYIEEGAQGERDGSSGSRCGPCYVLTCEVGLYLPHILPWATQINEERQEGSSFARSFESAGAGVIEHCLWFLNILHA